jgi:transcription initiation factor IIE alpha subunit
MATITLEYNARTKGIKDILNGLLELGVFTVKSTRKEEKYNPEFVRMIKEADAAPKTAMSLDDIKRRLGV